LYTRASYSRSHGSHNYCVNLPGRPAMDGGDLVAPALGRPAGYAMRSTGLGGDTG
jgi:hypothetical protein